MDGARIHAENSIRQKNQVYMHVQEVLHYILECVYVHTVEIMSGNQTLI